MVDRFERFKIVLGANRATRDAVVLAACGVGLWLFAAEFEIFEAFYEYSRAHEDMDLDEVLLALIMSGIMGFTYAVRRARDLRGEIERRSAAEHKVTWTATHDALTGLPNRHFLEGLMQGDEGLGPIGAWSHIAAIDLDGFKQINDLLGHDGGDALLRTVAARIQCALEGQLVVRMGGDEFVCFLADSENETPEAVAERLIETIVVPTTIADVEVSVGASIGLAHSTGRMPDLKEAVRQADVAMYSAKRQGRNRVAVFAEGLDRVLTERAEIEVALRQAIAQGLIEPHYQPLVNLKTGATDGFEVLARWRSDGAGPSYPPNVFIRVAEDIGLIIDLSEHLLRRACEDARSWPSDLKLSFNISPVQLTDTMLGLRIVRILAETGFLPQRLEIEITESALVRNMESALKVITDLRAAGIRVALDDFGTGYSSLSHLSKIAFDRIKIDRSFVASFEADEKQFKIVKAIVGLGQGLGIDTTAEGIEEASQLDTLRRLGCNVGQGYYFAKAMSAENVRSYLGAGDEDAVRHAAG